jgi:hypothetical protein
MTEPEPATTLNVRVTDNADGTARYVYVLRTSDGMATGPLQQEYSVEVNATLLRRLCARVDKVLEEALPGDVDHRAELSRYGQALYNQLFPMVGGNVPELVTKLRDSTGPLLVITNETEVPWELLHDEQEFLGLSRDLGRSPVVRRAFVPGRTGGSLSRALVVGDPLGDLPAARREAGQVAQWLRSHGTRCTVLPGERATLDDVVMELQSNPYDLFHYSGHVALAHNPAETGLLLHERSLLDERALQGIARPGAPPVVFINGCGAAGPIANLCVSFMVVGAKTVVGARADVAEGSARRFAEEFYRRLLADEPAGKAMREARAALVDERDAAWASFLLYGDPSVRVTGEKHGQPPPDRPDERWLRSYTFTAAAEDLMARAHAMARARGLVTSMDLLLALITDNDLRPAMEAAVGAKRLSTLAGLLHMILPDTAPDDAAPAGPERQIEPSDTVVNVLIQAENRVVAEGRTAITSRDIVTAFTEVGGGSSAVPLEVLGISLPQLIPVDSRPGADRPAAPEPFGELFDGDDRVRAGSLDRDANHGLRAARLLAKANGSVIGTFILLQGFALAGSHVLRQALAAQGDAGERAVHALSARLDPRRSDFSRRTLTALEEARRAEGGPVLGEVEILCALLREKDSSARTLLRRLGVDPETLILDLRRSG